MIRLQHQRRFVAWAHRCGARAIPALGLVLVLAGCMGETGDTGLNFLSGKTARVEAGAKAPTPVRAPAPALASEAELVRGKVVVRAPRGYCIDSRSMRRGLSGGFALIASCNSLSGDFGAADVEPVVMTVQVQPGLLRRDLPEAADLAAAMAPARPLRRIDGDGLTLVLLDSGGDRGLPAGDPRHWRGATLINGYLVGLALYAPKGNAKAGPGGQGLIHRLAENTLDASLGAAKRVEPRKSARKSQ